VSTTVKKLAISLASYGLPDDVGDPAVWVQACRRARRIDGTIDYREARRHYRKLGGIADAAGRAWRGIKSGFRAAAASLIPYLASLAVMEGPAFIRAVTAILQRAEVNSEDAQKLKDRLKTMVMADAIRYITTVAGADPRVVNQALRSIPPPGSGGPEPKIGVLSVDELDVYYTGDELPGYCPRCRNSDYTSTGKVGCTLADDPTVREFLDRLQSNQLVFPGEKCPRFEQETAINTPEMDLDAGGAESVLKVQGVAGVAGAMIKEVPSDPTRDFDDPDSSEVPEREVYQDMTRTDQDGLMDLVEDALADFVQHPTGQNAVADLEIVRGALRQLKRRRGTSMAETKDYNRLDWM